VVTGCSQVRLDYSRSLHAYANQRLQIQLELLMMSGMPLETCWAFNERWNNKFYYNVASCWLFLLIHTTMHGSMNIKFTGTIYQPTVPEGRTESVNILAIFFNKYAPLKLPPPSVSFCPSVCLSHFSCFKFLCYFLETN
jgi:hypothetical protein